MEADVIAWLKEQSFDEDLVIRHFFEKQVNGEMLSSLTKEGLEELGITSPLHQIKVATAIKRGHDRLKGLHPAEHSVEAWSEDDVFSWLSTQNFPSLDLERFKVEGIDGAMLVDLNDAALQELGIEAPLHRMMMRDVIDQLLLDPEGAAQKGEVKQIKFLEK